MFHVENLSSIEIFFEFDEIVLTVEVLPMLTIFKFSHYIYIYIIFYLLFQFSNPPRVWKDLPPKTSISISNTKVDHLLLSHYLC